MSLAGPHYHRSGLAPWPGHRAIAKQLDGVDVLLGTDADVLVLRAYPLDAAPTPDAAAQALIDAGLLQLPEDRGIAQIGTEATCERGTGWFISTIRALRAHGWGGRIAVGGWSVGNPQATAIPGCSIHFADAVALATLQGYGGDLVLAFDEYVSILDTDPRWDQWVQWTGSLHDQVATCLAHHGLAIPMVTLESGADSCQPDIRTPATGDWQSRGWADRDYLATMQALDERDQRSANYLGRCYYTVGASNEWARFNIDRLRDQGVLSATRSGGVPPSGPPPGTGATTVASRYCTEIGPDGSGHNRCGPAVIAHALLRAGWQSDPWGLTLEVTGKALGLPGPASADMTLAGGMTADQVANLLGYYGRPARVQPDAQQLLAAARTSAVTLWLVDNWYLRPRSYPVGTSWDALHWVAIAGWADSDVCILNDPLTWIPGEYPQAYQGYTTCTVASLLQAVYATDPSLPAGVQIG